MGKIKFDIAGWEEKLKNDADINKPDKDGKTALELAILADDIDAVKFCIANGADVNLNNKAMILAADCSKNPEIIEILVKNGADIEANCKDEMTPLMNAILGIKKNNYAVVKKMIDLGANVNAKDDKGLSVLFTSLAIVAKHNQEKIKLLIQSGADVNATDHDNETPLFWADWCDVDVIKTLIAAGADVNAKNNSGETAFTRIVKHGVTPDVFNFLINAGADINAKDNEGRTPLCYAARYCRNPNTIKALVKHGADINAKDNEGRTPLFYAAYGNTNPKIIEALIKCGADLNICDKTCNVALSYTSKNDVAKKILTQYLITKANSKRNKVVFIPYQTGFNECDKIMEIGAIELNKDNEFTGRTFHTYINPQCRVTRNNTKIFGPTRKFLKNYPIFDKIKGRLLKFIKGKELIVYDWKNDLVFLERELGFELPNKKIDCYTLGKIINHKKTKQIWHRIFAKDKDVSYHGALLDAYNYAIYYQEIMKLTNRVDKPKIIK